MVNIRYTNIDNYKNLVISFCNKKIITISNYKPIIKIQTF